MVSQDEVSASKTLAEPVAVRRSASWASLVAAGSSPSPNDGTLENYQVFDSLAAELEIETVNALLSVADGHSLQPQVGEKRVRQDEPECSQQAEPAEMEQQPAPPPTQGPPARKRMRVRTRARAQRHANLKGLLDAGLLHIGEKISMRGKAGLVMKEGWIEYPDTNERYPGAWTWANAIAEGGVEVPNLRASLSTQAEEQFGWESTMVESDGVPLQEFTEMYSAKEMEMAAKRRAQQAENARKREEQLARERRRRSEAQDHTRPQPPPKAAAGSSSSAEQDSSQSDFTAWVRKRKTTAPVGEQVSVEQPSQEEDLPDAGSPNQCCLPGSVSQSMLEDLLQVGMDSPMSQSLQDMETGEEGEDSPMVEPSLAEGGSALPGLPSSAEGAQLSSWEHGGLLGLEDEDEDEEREGLPKSILRKTKPPRCSRPRKSVTWSSQVPQSPIANCVLEDEDMEDADMEDAEGNEPGHYLEDGHITESHDVNGGRARSDVDMVGEEEQTEEARLRDGYPRSETNANRFGEVVGSYTSPPLDFCPDSAEAYPIIDGGYMASEEEDFNSLAAEIGSGSSAGSLEAFSQPACPKVTAAEESSSPESNSPVARSRVPVAGPSSNTATAGHARISTSPRTMPSHGLQASTRPEQHGSSSMRRSGPVLAASGLTSTMLRRIQALLSHIGGKLVKCMSSEVTHLVVLPDQTCAAPQKRTMKFMEAVLLGCHVVSYDWILQCIRQRSWASESSFLVTPPSTGCRIFDGLRFALYGDFGSSKASKRDLVHLIHLGGGKVYKRLPALPACAQEEPRRKDMVVLCDAGSTDLAVAEACFFEHGLEPLQYEYLFDCISNRAVLPLQPYSVCGLEESTLGSFDLQTQCSLVL